MTWRGLFNRLRPHPRSLESDLDEELALHRELKQRELEREGLSREEAHHAASRSLGNVTLFREDALAAWQFQWLTDLAADLRYGARSLRAQPGFVAASVLALTLGLGLNGIVFTVYNALALAPWAVRDPSGVVQILGERGPSRWTGFSWPEYRYLRDHSQTVTGITAWDNTGVRITRGELSWSTPTMAVAENFFDSIGTGFTFGRGFSPAADPKNPAPEVVLHYDEWQSRFGADPSILGQWIEISGRQLQVVGVAVAGFTGPTPTRVGLWMPAGWRDILTPGQDFIDTPNSCCAQVLGRLKPGVSRDTAEAELATLSTQFRRSVGREIGRVLLTTPAFLANPTTHSRAAPMFAILAVATILILLLACANVANLLLARGSARRREISVRLSLGAGRMRIIRQLLAESLLLSLIAGGLTVAISTWLPAVAMKWIAPADEDLTLRFAPDWRVAAFLVAACVVATLLFALLPALTIVRQGVTAGLREASARAASGNKLRLVLLTLQVTLCAVLLSGSSLLLRAVQKASIIETGFRYHDVILLSPGLNTSGISDEQARAPLAVLRSRIAALPGVVSVDYASVVPLGNSFEGTVTDNPRTGERVRIGVTKMSAGLFDTLGIPLLAGRGYTPADEGRKDIVIVSQSLANRMWPGENPIGKSLDPTQQVVGTVRDVGTRGLGSMGEAQMYLPSTGTRGVSFFVRHTGPASPLIASMPQLAREVDRRFFAAAAPYSDHVDRARRSAAVAASMSGVFSFIALTLAFVGLYAVAAYQVAQRTREIGVRMALGARPAQILKLMFDQSLRPVAIGAVLGMIGALALARLLNSLLYGLSPADPIALAMTITTLAATAFLAVWSPARRATSVDPASALRND